MSTTAVSQYLGTTTATPQNITPKERAALLTGLNENKDRASLMQFVFKIFNDSPNKPKEITKIKQIVAIVISYWETDTLSIPRAPKCIIGVMGQGDELGDLKKLIRGTVQELDRKKVGNVSRIAFKGSIDNDKEIVVISTCPGKVASAATIVELITVYKVGTVIIFGTAGGISNKVNVGDLVIGNRTIAYDVDFGPVYRPFSTPDQFTRGVSRGNSLERRQLMTLARKSAQQYFKDSFGSIELGKRKDLNIENPKVILATIATSDKFELSATDESRIKVPGSQYDVECLAASEVDILCSTISAANVATGVADLNASAEKPIDDVVCVEMEDHSVASVANEYGVNHVSMRLVSNYIGSLEPIDTNGAAVFQKFKDDIQKPCAEGIFGNLLPFVDFQTKRSDTEESSPVVSYNVSRVGIICDFESDSKSLASKFFSTALSPISYGSRNYYRHQNDSIDAVIVASGIGKIAAATTATDLILREKVSCIINVGRTFSMDSTYKEGQIVTAADTSQWDVNVKPFRDLAFVPGFGIRDFRADKRIVSLVENLVSPSFLRKTTVHISSADKLFSWSDRQLIRSIYPSTALNVCLDFSAGAIGQVGHMYNTPTAAIKVVVKDQKEALKANDSLVSKLHTTTKQVVELFSSHVGKEVACN